MSHRFALALFGFTAAWPVLSPAAETPSFTRTEDVVYGRKDGTALTMDVFRPKGKAIAVLAWTRKGQQFTPTFNKSVVA